MKFGYFLKRSLKMKLTVFSLAVLLVSIWLLAFFADLALRRGVQEIVGEQLASTASFAAEEIDEQLETRLQSLKDMASSITPEMMKNGEPLQALLEERKTFQRFFNGGTFVTDSDGIAKASFPVSAGRVGVGYIDKEHIFAALKEGKTTITKPFMGRHLLRPVFAMATPVRNAEGEVIGALAGVVDLSTTNFLDKIIHGSYAKTGGYVLIDPRHKLIVTGTDKRNNMRQFPAPGLNPLFDRYVRGYEGTGVTVDTYGVQVISAAKKIPAVGWIIVVKIPTAEAFASVAFTERRFALLTVFMTLLAGVFYWWNLQDQLAPMQDAVELLDAYADSSRPLQPLPVVKQDEIGRLIGGFNNLLETLGQREAALRESRRRLADIVQFFPDATFAVDRERRVIIWNKAVEEMTGIPASDMIGKGNYEYTIPFYGKRRRQLMDLVFEYDEDIAAFYTVLRRDEDRSFTAEIFSEALYGGKGAWVMIKAAPLHDSSGNIIGAIESIRDITERKRAEEELRESEDKFKCFAEQSLTGIYLIQDGIFKYVNPKFAEMFGYTLDECLHDKPFKDLIAPDDRPLVEEQVRRRISGEAPFSHYTYKGMKKDGRTFDVEVYGSATLYKGKPAALGTILDISARRQAEGHVQRLHRQNQIILDAAPATIWFKDTENRFLRVNKRTVEMIGKSAAEIEGKLAGEVFPEWLAEKYHRDDLEVINSGRPKMGMEEQYANAAGELRWVRTDKIPWFDESGNVSGVLAFAVDITEIKEAEEEKRRMQAQLAHAQKMEAIGTLAGGIAHDFNNILGVIIGYTEMVREDCPADSRMAKDLAEVLKAGNRARSLIKQILAFSRKEAGHAIVLQPATIVKEVVKMLRSSLPSTIQIRQDIDTEAELIFADPTQLHQMLMNLCTNAFHAMEETGGMLFVSLQSTDLGANEVSGDFGIEPGKYIKLSVRDTGPGIASEIRERIFEPYFTTKPMGKGTGMGLAIVHGIVKSCGGFVTCDSRIGKGSEFTIYIPVSADQELPEPESALPSAVGSERILFVDDETVLVKMATTMFQRLGYSVTAASDSFDALRIFSEDPDGFDLVITDQTMPKMTGIDLSRKIMEIRADMPIILCTGYSSTISREKVLESGIKGFALKPFAKKDLAELIRTILEKRES